jgi:hypothetical protein
MYINKRLKLTWDLYILLQMFIAVPAAVPGMGHSRRTLPFLQLEESCNARQDR